MYITPAHSGALNMSWALSLPYILGHFHLASLRYCDPLFQLLLVQSSSIDRLRLENAHVARGPYLASDSSGDSAQYYFFPSALRWVAQEDSDFSAACFLVHVYNEYLVNSTWFVKPFSPIHIVPFFFCYSKGYSSKSLSPPLLMWADSDWCCRTHGYSYCEFVRISIPIACKYPLVKKYRVFDYLGQVANTTSPVAKGKIWAWRQWSKTCVFLPSAYFLPPINNTNDSSSA